MKKFEEMNEAQKKDVIKAIENAMFPLIEVIKRVAPILSNTVLEMYIQMYTQRINEIFIYS